MNPYSVLGVNPQASEDEIKKSYRNLCKKYHPDANDGSDEKIKEINEAYSQLTSKNKNTTNQGFSGFGSQFDAFFSDMIRDRRRQEEAMRNAPRDGQPFAVDKEIPLKEFLFGGELKVSVEFEDLCGECRGEGGLEFKECTKCMGSGMEEMRHQQGHMSSINVIPCRVCSGKGKISTKPCKCGSGVIKNKSEFMVPIEPMKGLPQQHIIPSVGRSGINGGNKGPIVVRLTNLSVPNIPKEGLNKIREILNASTG